MTVFEMTHSASRWDRSIFSLVRASRQSLSEAAVAGYTEVAGLGRRTALRRLLKRRGYALLQKRPGPIAEVAIGVDREVYEIVRWNSVKIGPDLGPGDIVVATIALLRNLRTGEKILVGDAHLPATVEGARGFIPGDRSEAYRKCVQRYRRLVNKWTVAFEPDATIIWADWNLNAHRGWVCAYFAAAWPELRIPALPDGATHAGGRFIDFPLVRGFADIEITLVDQSKASDHTKRVLFRARIRD